jgi:hypothetical protein
MNRYFPSSLEDAEEVDGAVSDFKICFPTTAKVKVAAVVMTRRALRRRRRRRREQIGVVMVLGASISK